MHKKNQTAQGYWNSYWWNDNLYATASCMNALKYQLTTDSEVDACLCKAKKWILNEQLIDGSWTNTKGKDGTPFSTALALKGLLVQPQNALQSILNGVEWILKNQLEDGSWISTQITNSSSFIYRSLESDFLEGWWKSNQCDHRR